MIGSPVSVISRATLNGIRVPSRVPPPPGIRPRCTSGRPNVACVGGDDHVAAEQQLEPARDGGAVGRGDEGHGDLTVEQPIEGASDVIVAEVESVARRKSAQVHAGTERAVAAAGEHDGAQIRVALRVDDRRTDRADEVRGERVACLGTVEPRDQDRASLLAHERRGVGHPL